MATESDARIEFKHSEAEEIYNAILQKRQDFANLPDILKLEEKLKQELQNDKIEIERLEKEENKQEKGKIVFNVNGLFQNQINDVTSIINNYAKELKSSIYNYSDSGFDHEEVVLLLPKILKELKQ